VRKKLCTHIKKHGRKLTLRPQAEHEAIQARRQYQQTETFRKEYAIRAGVEGVISQATNAFEMRRSRYRGLAKTHFQHLATATAINLKRAIAWFQGVPTASTQLSSFATLAPA
jgi:transposase